ncbi:MAG: hypothetical protein K9G33_07515 [Sneathiella sp.]|nr:hypothetical protein [Sneathiella sp.]
MIRTGRKKEWSILLFVACLIAFMPPVLVLFDKADRVFGIPLGYLYLFGAWAGIIVVTAIGAKRRPEKLSETESAPRNGNMRPLLDPRKR